MILDVGCTLSGWTLLEDCDVSSGMAAAKRATVKTDSRKFPCQLFLRSLFLSKNTEAKEIDLATVKNKTEWNPRWGHHHPRFSISHISISLKLDSMKNNNKTKQNKKKPCWMMYWLISCGSWSFSFVTTSLALTFPYKLQLRKGPPGNRAKRHLADCKDEAAKKTTTTKYRKKRHEFRISEMSAPTFSVHIRRPHAHMALTNSHVREVGKGKEKGNNNI